MSGPGESPPEGGRPGDPEVEVDAVLARLDETDPAAHADAFETVNATILAELRRLEAL